MDIDHAKTCCVPLATLLESAGKRGLGLIVVDIGELRFELQSRGVAHADLDELRGKQAGFAVPVGLKHGTSIQHCPFCGTSLADLVMLEPDYHRALARRHQPLDND